VKAVRDIWNGRTWAQFTREYRAPAGDNDAPQNAGTGGGIAGGAEASPVPERHAAALIMSGHVLAWPTPNVLQGFAGAGAGETGLGRKQVEDALFQPNPAAHPEDVVRFHEARGSGHDHWYTALGRSSGAQDQF